MKNILLLTCILTAFITSCELYPQDEYEEFYVVESYLVANRQLPPVRLSTTIPATEFYSFEEASINNALVEIHLLANGPESAAVDTFYYSNSEPGIYNALEQHAVLPARTYELKISFPNNSDIIRAYTVVPEAFQIMGGVRDSVVYQSTEQLQITLSASSYPTRQNIFVFNALGQFPIEENLTPVYEDLLSDSDQKEEDLNIFANNSSGIINEANFELHPDGSVTVDYPWIGIAFYDYNLIVANTIDDNVYDFVRSQSVQLGGSTLSPGEIQNVIYHVEGGIGLFGSLASDTTATYVKRNPFLQ